MGQILAGKIDVTKIDKNRLYAGKKGTYLDVIIMLNDEVDEYGNNGMITQSVSKEERLSGVKGNILGNVKVISEGQRQTSSQPQQRTQEPEDDNFSDLPF